MLEYVVVFEEIVVEREREREREILSDVVSLTFRATNSTRPSSLLKVH